MIRALLTVLIAALAASCATPPSRTAATVYSDDGLSELVAPESWRTRPNMGRNATIRLGDDSSANYLLLTSYVPGEADPVPLERFAERVSGALASRLAGAKRSAPRPLTVHGRAAVEYEISGSIGELPLVYLSTVVEGARARHHLVAWTLAERYRANQAGMRAAVASFRESSEPRPAKARTDLTFKWPSRMSSTATVKTRSVKRGEVLEMQARAVSSVRPLGKNELLVSGKIVDKRFSPAVRDKEKANYLERVLQEATTDVPDYVVDRDGEFVRIENLGPYLKRLEDALVEGLPEAPREARAKAQELVRRLITQETLSASVQDEWNNVVGNWVDGSYVPGHVYEVEMSYHSPLLGSEAFPMQVTQQLAGREPCRRGAAPDSCVRLVQTSRVSDPGFTRAMSAFVRKTVGAEVSVERAEVLKTVEVLADPKTLLPYRSLVKETKTFVVSAKGEGSRTSEETQESVTTYSY